MKEKLKANIFPAAWPAVEPWRAFPWDRGPQGIRTWVPHSSQALAIDVFGTIKACGVRDVILDALADHIGVPRSGQWTVHLEWIDPYNEMREKRRTQIDCVLKNKASLIFVECKFTEKEGGSCSRPRPNRDYDGIAQCNGNYEPQTDPIRYSLFDYFGVAPNDAKCALTREGIRYWEFLGQVLQFDSLGVYRPCPFAGSMYQWMRNVLLCHLVAARNRLVPAFLIAFADASGLAIADSLNTGDLRRQIESVLMSGMRFRPVSFQEVIQVALSARTEHPCELRMWRDLDAWVKRKIRHATAGKVGQWR